MKYKIGVISLGCAKNQVDAEMMLYRLKQAGFDIVKNTAKADAVIVNTCGFIETAKQESINEILKVAQLKKEGKIKSIIVTGCLAQRYQKEVMTQLYEVDAVLGIGANSNIAEAVLKSLQGEKSGMFPSTRMMPLDGGRIQTTPPHYAYLKIADGCDNCCTYCAIPMIRGEFRSRRLENILQEAEKLAAAGVKELLVIAQDTTRYGEDIYGGLMLGTLLTELCKIEGIRWIRVLYCYPDRITDELLNIIAKEEKIVKYLDLPLQHCNERILKLMNRRGSTMSLKRLVEKIRGAIPGVVLRTTLITGFPSETEEEFEELSEFVELMKFERLGCFAYSQEEGTAAAELDGQIDDYVKNRRAAIIMEQQQIIMEQHSRSLISRTVEVLAEGVGNSRGWFYGRSYWDAPEVDGVVFFKAEGEYPAVGAFVKVEVTNCKNGNIYGRILERME